MLANQSLKLTPDAAAKLNLGLIRRSFAQSRYVESEASFMNFLSIGPFH